MGETMDGVLDRMRDRLAPMRSDDPGRYFLATYLRTTQAVAAELAAGTFEDPEWIERYDVTFAGFYLDAVDAHRADPATAPRPWRIAFGQPRTVRPVVHLLLGVNAHINYDLPQALVEVISPVEFADPALIARRRRDHERIDAVLASRVGAEDGELAVVSGPASLRDRVLRPVNLAMTARFLRESRRKVWHNARCLSQARVEGEAAYRSRVHDLDALASARVAELTRPGLVLIRLGLNGFGVTLPPA
ncbi:MAG: hypothetical protein JNL54_06660 [Kineosporiaceae bacterium]|nr:hypothetical protein [Kineosporiaceae bacterium]